MRISKRFWLTGVAALAGALGVVWSARRPLADNALRDVFAARNVAARYVVREIGFRTQRLEQLSLGDPARPDLTADWIEIDVTPTWTGARIVAIRASGLRVRGRFTGDRVSWGVVDRLLPAPTEKKFSLPPIETHLSDTVVVLGTPYGTVSVRVDGAGRLDNGFRGRALVEARHLARGKCQIDQSRGAFDFALTDSLPMLRGPVNAAAVMCENASLRDISGSVETKIGHDASTGQLALRAEKASYGGHHAEGVRFDGSIAQTGATQSVRGRMQAVDILPDPGLVASARQALISVKTGPIDAIARTLVNAVDHVQRGMGGELDFALERRNGRVAVSVDQLTATAASGARLSLQMPSSPVSITGEAQGRTLTARLGGGGFPDTALRLSGDFGKAWRGRVTFAPMQAGSAQLALDPVRLEIEPSGRFSARTRLMLDGPLPDGRIEGLSLPIALTRAASGALALAPGCVPLSIRALRIADVRFDPIGLPLCPAGGKSVLDGIGTGALRLTGRSDAAPLVLAADSLRLARDGRIALAGLNIRLGRNDAATRLALARLEGRLTGAPGRFTGMSGEIAGVPLRFIDGSGTWRFANGVLDVGGNLSVSDPAEKRRFETLAVDAAKLRLKDGRIAATGTLLEPKTRRKVAAVSIAHRLSGAEGEARIDVEALTFGKTLQPEMLTPQTKDILAYTQGTIAGIGTIRWKGDTVTSSGRFSTDGLDFAAGIGTVVGARGTIEFDDLLALTTPRGQRVFLATVNPGVQVEDGEIVYRLRPNQLVEIERGRWPFAGGTLTLDPAKLDFGTEGLRRLVFRVEALDAGKFIERLQLDNIAATGTFDGVLPVVFGTNEGRIEGGRIVARGPGALAYVGDVSNAQTNAMTRLAFDALKAIRYRNLAIELDGALDGEIVSRVIFAGTNQAPVAPSGLARSFTGLPFRFNVVIRAPFRGLVNTAKSFQDPAALIQGGDSATKP